MELWAWVDFLGWRRKVIALAIFILEPDYHFHLGTRRGGMAVRNPEGIKSSIHNIENNYFRSKFEPDLAPIQGAPGDRHYQRL